MLQRVIAAYHRLASVPNWSWGARFFRTAAGQRSVVLNVLVLEERATPAGTERFLPPIQPPVAVLVAPISAVSFQTQPAVDNGSAASVRSDLFGPGDMGKPENADELEEMLANEHASKEATAGQAEAHRQVTDAPNGANETSSAETVVVDDMVYLPPVD